MTEPQQELRDAIPLEELPNEEEKTKQVSLNWKKILLGLAVFIILTLVVIGLKFLFQPGTNTARIRDIFIIFMALEFLLIGVAMIVLIAQLARLTLLLQNEIKPILDSTNETANTLKGTTAFLSEHLVEPVLKMNQYLAGLNRIVSIFKSEKQ
jgi:hypothetical protein